MRISQSKTAIFLGALLTIVGCGSSGGKGGSSTDSLIPAEYSTKLNGLEITSDNKAQVKENQKKAIDVDANTTRGQVLIYSIYGTDVAYFDMNESTGIVTFKEAPDYENDANKTAYFFTVKVSDKNAELSQDINITIVNINDEKPIFVSSATKIVNEKQLNAITLKATDKDKDKLTYALSGVDVASFNVAPLTGVVTFKTAPLYRTKTHYTFIAEVSDGMHKTGQQVTVNIKDPSVNNTKPKITSTSTAEVEENQKSAIDIDATDADGHTLTYSISGTDVDSFNIDATTGVVTFKEAPDYETKKEYHFTAKVSDGYEEVEQEITITIKNVNDAAPVITSAATAKVPEGETYAMTVTATDAEGDKLEYIIFDGEDASSFNIDSTTGVVTFKEAPDYETEKEYNFNVTVSDGEHSVSQPIIITILDDESDNDTTAPVITLKGTNPMTITVGEAYTEKGATATDNVDTTVTVNKSGTVDTNTAGTYTITYTATDKAGNKATKTRTVTVKAKVVVPPKDTTAPVITLKGEKSITLNVGEAYTEKGATATDNVDENLSAKIVINSSTVDTTAEGNYTVTYNVSDAAGNKAPQVTRAVTVKAKVVVPPKDTTAPIITLKGTNPITLNVGDTYTDAGATAKDDKDGDISAKIVINSSTVDTTAEGNYTVTYDVSDAAGNKAPQVTRAVTVKAKVVVPPKDTTAPIITLKGTNPMTINEGDTYADAGATAKDNKDGDISAKIVSNATTAVNTNKVGTYTVTYNVSDAAGNKAAQVTRTVTVKKKLIEDTVAPTITLLGNNEVNLTVGDVYADAGATAKDDKDGDITAKIVSNATTAVNTNKVGTYTVTYNVSDAAGNKAPQVTRTVTVKAKVVVPPKDTTAPVITLKGTNPMTITVGEAYTEKGATATDNVDENLSAKIVINSSTVDTTAEGNYTVTYDVKDTAGNDAQQVIRKVNVTN